MNLRDYCKEIDLFGKKIDYTKSKKNLSIDEKKEIVDFLITEFLSERNDMRDYEFTHDYKSKRSFLRALLNMRPATLIDNKILTKLNKLLQSEVLEKGIIEIDNIKYNVPKKSNYKNNKKFILLEGDITLLKVDAIVNSANSDLMGCFNPLHECVDNEIHSIAGPMLREACKIIINIQGEEENIGDAKITPGYNLPSKYVLHTVGPIVEANTNKEEEIKLAKCYTSCLELASQITDVNTIAFPCIATNNFGFPKKEAAKIAINTVDRWLIENESRLKKIIFTTHNIEDYEIYFKLLQS